MALPWIPFFIVFSIYVYQTHGLCIRQSDIVRLTFPGFHSGLVHTNNCLEISGSLIKPEIQYGAHHDGTFERQVLDSCCCRVTNYSEQKVHLKKSNSTERLSIRFKRIESCGCVPCHNNAKSHTPQDLFSILSRDTKDKLEETLTVLNLL